MCYNASIMKSNKILKQEALDTIQGKWGSIIGATAVYFLVMTVLSFNVSPKAFAGNSIFILLFVFVYLLLRIVLTPSLMIGINTYSLRFSRNQEVKISTLFEDFKSFVKMRRNLNLIFLRAIFTFLWYLLLLIPGIIASIAYSQAVFISIDEPGIGASDAIDKSKKMMDGYKWKYFLLSLSFIGWGILGIITLGIGFLWITPYMRITQARFYEDLKAQNSDSIVPSVHSVPAAPLSEPAIVA